MFDDRLVAVRCRSDDPWCVCGAVAEGGQNGEREWRGARDLLLILRGGSSDMAADKVGTHVLQVEDETDDDGPLDIGREESQRGWC
jgi:hypothetical protein